MATNDKLAKLVAEIATDGELPKTSAEYLAVISRAVRGGYALGVVQGQNHISGALDLLLTPRKESPIKPLIEGFDHE